MSGKTVTQHKAIGLPVYWKAEGVGTFWNSDSQIDIAVCLFLRVKNPEQFCRRDHNGGSWEMLRVSRDQICSLLGKGNLVEHDILGVGKDFFCLGPFQREAFLKNHIQYGINQLGREMELGPG